MLRIKDLSRGISLDEERFNKAKAKAIKGVGLLIRALELEQEEKKNNKINRIDFHGLRIFYEQCDRVQCRFIYIRNGLQSSFDFPLSVGLKEPCLQVDEQQKAAQTYTLPINKRTRDYNELFIAALYHPITTVFAGVLGAINLLYIAGISTVATPMAGAGMLGISIAYFIPPLIYKIAKTKLRRNLLDVLQRALDDIYEKKSKEASIKINSLGLVYNIMLHQYFPGNIDLKWCFNYVHARISFKKNLAEEAFELSETPDQLFLVLRMFLDDCNRRRKGMFHDKLLPSMLLNDQVCKEIFEKHEKSFSKYLKPYINLIPINSQQHQELAAQMKQQLMSCYNSLSNSCIEEACHKFTAIKWDGYCKVAYPAAAILYYELKAVLTLASEGLNVKLNSELCVGERLDFACKSLEKTKKIIDEFYSAESEEYQKYFESFEDFDLDMRKVFRSVKPGKPIITLAEMQPKERIIDLSEHPYGYTKILRVVNRLYHIGTL
jgi:hypothetical protein